MQAGTGTPWATAHRAFCDALSVCPGEDPQTKGSRNRVINTPAALVLGWTVTGRHPHPPGRAGRNLATHCPQGVVTSTTHFSLTCLTSPVSSSPLPTCCFLRSFPKNTSSIHILFWVSMLRDPKPRQDSVR